MSKWQRLMIGAALLTFMVSIIPVLPTDGQENNGPDAKDSSTEINVRDAELAAIVRIFSKKTKRNYILDERVKGKVSIYLPGRVSSGEAVRILDSVLALKGFTSVPIGDNIWKIIPAQEAKQTTIPTVDEISGRGSPTVVTTLVNLKHVAADDLKQLLTPLVSSYGLLNAYTGSNSLIIIDSEENVKRIKRIINELDIPFTDREMVIVPVEFADAVDVAEKINEIISDGEDKDSNPTSPHDFIKARLDARSRLTNGSENNATSTGQSITVAARSRAPKIIADQRTNSIIVVADEENTAKVRALISQLDSQVDLSGNQFFVYRCQHASAEELAQVLAGMANNKSNSSSGSTTTGLSRTSINRTQQSEGRLSQTRRTPGQSRSTSNDQSGQTGSFNFGDEITITADPSTNSLVIYASRNDYDKMKTLLKELDIKRKQVLVEAAILEVRITEGTQLGTTWIGSGGGADGGLIGTQSPDSLASLLTNPAEFFANPSKVQGLTVAAASSGTLSLPGGVAIPSQSALVTAAANSSNVNILSSPTILTTDNEEAEIIVGENVPFLASTSTSETNLNNTFNQIDRQDVGITLRITPQISSSNFVTLRIFTEVSNVVEESKASTLGPTTTIRTSETTVITKDGQMVVTGGLIGDLIEQTETGVPFLKDIPVLGHLFKVEGERQVQTNLLIFITPRILDNQYDARDETIERRNVMQNVIEHYEMTPTRAEILQNRDIDRVTETEIYDGKKPSTILPPTKPEIVSNKKNNTQATVHTSSAPILELEARPEIPSAPTAKFAPSQESVFNANSQVVPASRRIIDEKGALFVILQPLDQTAADNFRLPLVTSPSGVLLPITIPAGSSQTAQSFFEAGQHYCYQANNHCNRLRALGIFTSRTEAETFYGVDAARWHTLSPHEIMNLGKQLWQRDK